MFYLQPLTLTLLLGFLFLGVSALQTLSPSTTTVVPLIVSKKDNSSEVNKTNQETSAKGVKNAEISPSPPPSMPKGPRAYTTQPPSTDEKASGAKNKSSIGIKDTSSKMLSDEEWGSIEFSAMNEKGKALVMILWTNFTAALFYRSEVWSLFNIVTNSITNSLRNVAIEDANSNLVVIDASVEEIAIAIYSNFQVMTTQKRMGSRTVIVVMMITLRPISPGLVLLTRLSPTKRRRSPATLLR